MNKQVYQKGMGMLQICFRSLEIHPKAMWSLLKDLSDEEFAAAITQICKKTVELYPNTNLCALVRQEASKWRERNQPELDMRKQAKQLEEWRQEALPASEQRVAFGKIRKLLKLKSFPNF